MRKKGYTVIELMVTLAIAGTLTALAVYNFAEPSPHRQLKEASQTLVGHLRLARQKAMAEGKEGEMVFDNRQEYHYSDPALLGKQKLPPQIQFGTLPGIKKSPSGEKNIARDGISFKYNKVTFQPNGTIETMGTLYLKNDREASAITVNITGRVKQFWWDGHNWKDV